MRRLALLALAAFGFIATADVSAFAHGCHRSPQYGKYGLHRHAGPYCDRIDLDGDGYYEERRRPHLPPGAYVSRDGQICRQVCQGVGPLRFCERKCN